MAAAYDWLSLDDAGREMTEAPARVTSTFFTQADAEAWLAQEWETLADAGVAAVTLRRDGVVVYGPMSLDPAS